MKHSKVHGGWLYIIPKWPLYTLNGWIVWNLNYIPIKLLRARVVRGLPRWHSGEESDCRCRRHGFDPWAGKIIWRRKWQPTPVFLPGKLYGQRSLVGYSTGGSQRVGQDLATKPPKRESYEHLFPTNSMVSDILLVGWYQPWWEYLYRGNRQCYRWKLISSGELFLHIYQYPAVKWNL